MGDEELTAAIRDLRERIRTRHPQGPLSLNGVSAADLMPLVHARDAAEAKVAAIGTVNPRRPGLKNSIVQRVKRMVARALDWHVREQVEFNRAAVQCVNTAIEALAETNRALAALAGHVAENHQEMGRLYSEAQELKDVRAHWVEWRAGFEERRNHSEIHMLRTISELQSAFQHRVTLIEQNVRELTRQQHADFEAALDRTTLEVQAQLWRDLEKIRVQYWGQIHAEYDKLIHDELKLIRQKAWLAPPSSPAPPPQITIDWLRFAHVFRGPEERIREQQKRYVAKFAGSSGVLDLGCGRGEFLEAAREAGLAARGIDQSEECVAICRSKQLTVERAGIFEYLDGLPGQSLGGVYCSQVVEHFPPERLPDLIKLLARKMARGELLAIETPNPECLAIFATHFYLDPTHTRPVPPALLRFYMEEEGFGSIEVERLSPAAESMPALNDLPASVRDALFGGLDYAIFGRRL